MGARPLALAVALPSGHTAGVRFTSAADGDLAVGQPAELLDERRRDVVPLPWTWLRQEHGRRVVSVGAPGAAAGTHADAAVTAVPGAALAVHTADCPPVALIADEGVVAAVHAGWRGLAAGVVEAAVDAMRRAGAVRVRAVIGPCIHPCCYEFGAADLDRVAVRYGDGVRATTSGGRPALDMPTAVASALQTAGAEIMRTSPACTGCSVPAMFSHRARGDTARHAMVVWLQ